MQALLFGFDRFSSFDAVGTVLLDLFFGILTWQVSEHCQVRMSW